MFQIIFLSIALTLLSLARVMVSWLRIACFCGIVFGTVMQIRLASVRGRILKWALQT